MIAVRFDMVEVFLAPTTWLDQLRTLLGVSRFHLNDRYSTPPSIVAVNIEGIDEIWHLGKAWWR